MHWKEIKERVMYIVKVKSVFSNNEEDTESYSFNTLPELVDINNNLFKSLTDEIETDYLSVAPYRVIEYPKMFILGDDVKIFVYQNDTVTIGFE